jgi:magnesium transporter
VSIGQLLELCEKSPDTAMGKGADFFLHGLIDRMMERYLPMVEDLAEEISWAEQEVFYNPDEKLLSAIFNLKKDMIYIRRIMLPQRDTILQLSKGDYPLISEKARLYFRDTYDLLYRINDLIESYRDLVNSTIEAYLIMDSNRANKVMKALSVMAAIFLPLTVITGVYGMNFRYMPELDWKWGYPFAWVLMITVVTCLLVFMKKRDWL